MSQEQVIAPVEQTAPHAADAQKIDAVDSQQDQQTPEKAEPAEKEDHDALPSWAKKQLRKAERRINTLTKRLGSYEERLSSGLPSREIGDTNHLEQDDSEPLSLSRKQIDELVEKRAREIAPALKERESVIERRRGVVEGLAKTLGQDKFDELASDLDAAFDGLRAPGGDPKPAADAIFEADDPKAVIEYLADPDNADEAKALSRMSAVQAGRAIAKLEIKLGEKAKAKPEPSKAPAPIDLERGRGTVSKAPDPSNTKAWIRWMDEQEAKGHYR